MKKSFEQQFYMNVVMILVILGTTFCGVTSVQNTVLAASASPSNSAATIKTSSNNEHANRSNTINITVTPGKNQSKLAVEAVRQIRAQRPMSNATAGKLQDKIMHYMGYQDVIFSDTSYTLDEKTIDNLLYNAYVYDNEITFWQDYAHKVGLDS